MGHSTAEAVIRSGCTLVPFSFTGQSEAVAVGNVGVCGIPVELVPAAERQAAAAELKAAYPGLVVVDYTLPAAVNDNARFYCDNGLPFVMGTTGGDREALLRDVAASGCYAVIAPNMGKQIVAFQTMMETMAAQFPGCFAGYSLAVVESHQRTKVDTSGTAKAVVASFQKMGLDFDEVRKRVDRASERCNFGGSCPKLGVRSHILTPVPVPAPQSQIEKVRRPQEQIERMGVPEAAVPGHAFHTYTLTSPDGSVTLEFKHNVCGRDVYAEGTVDAALFLAQQVAAGAEKRLYSMIDVLSAGAMR